MSIFKSNILSKRRHTSQHLLQNSKNIQNGSLINDIIEIDLLLFSTSSQMAALRHGFRERKCKSEFVRQTTNEIYHVTVIRGADRSDRESFRGIQR